MDRAGRPRLGRSGAAGPRSRGAPPRGSARPRRAAAGFAGSHAQARLGRAIDRGEGRMARGVRPGPAAASGRESARRRQSHRGGRRRRGVGLRPDRGSGGARGAAGAPTRGPVERQRPRRARRTSLDDRSGRLRRPPRDRPGDAAPVRRAERPDLRRLRRGVPARRGATATGSPSGSSCRCWSTPCCSAARTGAPPATRPAATPERRLRRQLSGAGARPSGSSRASPPPRRRPPNRSASPRVA